MKIKIEKIYNLIFFVSYFFLLLYSILGENIQIHDYLSKLSSTFLLLVFVTFLLQIKQIKKSELLPYIFILIMGVVFSLFTKDFLFLKFAIILFLSKNIVFDKRIKYDLIIRSIILVITYIFYNAGLTQDVVNYTSSGTIRHSYGLSNPNVLALHLLICIFELFYLNKNQKKKSIYILTMVIAIVSYRISLSRTALIGYLLLIFLNYLYIHKNKIFENMIVKKIIIYLPVFLFFVLIVFYRLYVNNNSTGEMINELLSGRLANIQYYIKTFNLTLIGNKNGLISDVTIDNVPIYFLYSFGIVGFLIYEIGFIELLKKLYSKKDYLLILIFVVFLIYGLSERLWIYIDYNIFMSAFTFLFFESGEKYDET